MRGGVINKYGVPEYDSENQSPEEYIKELGTDAKKKELAKMILLQKKRRLDFYFPEKTRKNEMIIKSL